MAARRTTSPTDDAEALFLEEIAAYLDTQELLPVALWDSLPSHDDALPLDLLEGTEPPEASRYSQERDSAQAAAAAAPQQPPPVVAAAKSKSRNLSRERMQNELRLLRAQSKELERQLAALQGGERYHASSQQELRVRASWERVAKRQLELRTTTEAENARLKVQLEAQIVTARNLQASLSQHAGGGFHQASPPLFSTHSFESLTAPGGFASSEDTVIYKQLLAELDDTWLQMNSVFQENGLSKMRVSSSIPSQARMKTRRSPCESSTNRQGSLYIELIEAEVLPFERDLVFNVMWECWARREAAKKVKEHYLVFEHRPMEVIASMARINTTFKGCQIPLDLIHVARVYRDNDRLCYVWRGVTKADSHFPGVLIDETGWQVMKPTTCSSSPSTRGTEILTCWQLESKSRSGKLDSSRVSPLTNLVISTAEAETMEVNSRMLKMLLQET